MVHASGMPPNRSVSADLLLPHITYKDLLKAIDWLSRAFGCAEHYHYGEPVSGAQMRLGNDWVMVSTAPGQYRSPAELGFGTQCLTLFIEDVDGHFERAKAAGTQVVKEPHETLYGEYQYGRQRPRGTSLAVLPPCAGFESGLAGRNDRECAMTK